MTDDDKTRERLLEELETSRQRVTELDALHRMTIDSLADAVHLVDRELRIVVLNRRFTEWCDDLGLPSDIEGRRLDDAFPFLPDEVFEQYRLVLETGQHLTTEEEVELAGRVLVTETRKAPILDGEKVTGVLTIIRDITERRQAEDQVRASLREKEVLLREVHHRVKNNLQVVISLLRLQSRQVVDEQALRAFANSEERIKAMALLHEMLYSSDSLSEISCRDYVGKLTDALSRLQLSAGATRLTVDVADISIDLDHAVPMGLILNELVSNALKHAFPGDEQGEVRVSIQPIGEAQLELVVSDDGVGLPEDVDPQQARSLGLRLVVMLARQLGGTLHIDRESGSTFRIRFEHVATEGRT